MTFDFFSLSTLYYILSLSLSLTYHFSKFDDDSMVLNMHY